MLAKAICEMKLNLKLTLGSRSHKVYELFKDREAIWVLLTITHSFTGNLPLSTTPYLALIFGTLMIDDLFKNTLDFPTVL